ncbi:uncharacterized protein LOC103996695 isoform X4 [Musa acuminata AAA Group]|uniref:uncharacterized protein LOC103996695 isoform X4 n=1 Tax=Musa acuminata AAA Group TaxID=214697 RepID=UPI0031DA6065
MDFQSSSGYSVSSSNIDMWGWQEEGFCLARDSQLGLPQCLWGDNNQKDESLLSTLGDQTPIKDCRDLGVDVMHTSDKAKKVVEEGQEASRGKRRRILQFTSDADGTTADNEQLSAPVPISKEDSMVDDGCPKDSQYNPICSSAMKSWISHRMSGWSTSMIVRYLPAKMIMPNPLPKEMFQISAIWNPIQRLIACWKCLMLLLLRFPKVQNPASILQQS